MGTRGEGAFISLNTPFLSSTVEHSLAGTNEYMTDNPSSELQPPNMHSDRATTSLLHAIQHAMLNLYHVTFKGDPFNWTARPRNADHVALYGPGFTPVSFRSPNRARCTHRGPMTTTGVF